MKFLASLCLLLTFGLTSLLQAEVGDIVVQPNPNEIRWYTDYSEAVKEAQKTHLPLLLFFTGSDWCGWCKKMDAAIFSSPEFIKEAKNSFIFVELDFPMNKKLPPKLAEQNAKLKQQHGITGYPTIILLDYNGNFVGRTGYVENAQAFLTRLKELMQG